MQVNCYSITSSRRLPCQLPWREEFWHSLPINKTKSHQKDRKSCHYASLPVNIQLDNPRFQFWPRWEKSRFHERKYWNVEVIWVYSRDPSLLLPHFRCHHCLPQVSHWDPGHEASHFTQEKTTNKLTFRALTFLTLCEMEGTLRVNWDLNDRWTWLSLCDVHGSNHVKQTTLAAHATKGPIISALEWDILHDQII